MGTKYGVLWCMVTQEARLDVRDKAGRASDSSWMHIEVCGLGESSLKD